MRGYWSSGVFDRPPRIGARLVRVDGKFATEAEAIAKADAVIKEGRPDIGTFIDRKTAKPSVSFHISHDDLMEIGRTLAQEMSQAIPHKEPYIAPSSLGVVIRKHGYFYRSEWAGYTAVLYEAGVYDRAVANRHAEITEGVTVHEVGDMTFRWKK